MRDLHAEYGKSCVSRRAEGENYRATPKVIAADSVENRFYRGNETQSFGDRVHEQERYKSFDYGNARFISGFEESGEIERVKRARRNQRDPEKREVRVESDGVSVRRSATMAAAPLTAKVRSSIAARKIILPVTTSDLFIGSVAVNSTSRLDRRIPSAVNTPRIKYPIPTIDG